jgi:nucleotide-binding universal stress UspA family protein
MDRILACVDHSAVTPVVVAQAASLAKMSGARLTLLHVVPADPEWVGYEVGPQTVRDAVAHELRDEHRATQALANALRERSIDARGITVQGPTVDRIIEQARALNVDVVVIGAHRYGPIRELFVGSIARQVIHRAACPVLLVPAPE